MRVCFIEDTGLRGGTQIWVSEAVRDFRSKGADVTLLTSENGWNAEDGRTTDVDLVTYDYDAVTRRDDEERMIWTRALDGADVAVCTVHPPRNGFHCSVFAAQCIADAGLDTVLVPKSGTIVPEYERRYYKPDPDINYHVAAITGFTRDYMVSDYEIPADHVELVYQGTDILRYTPSDARAEAAKERYPLRAGAGPVLGCVGSFEERKGQVLLLDAIDRARKDLPDILLLLVGDGPDKELLERAVAEKGLSDNVLFVPFTSEPEYIFELLDFHVLASTHKEGLPNVLLESMAMEVPVVSTRLAGTPEVVFDGETGLLVEPGNMEELADAIVRIGGDAAARRKMAVAGRTLMTENFDKRRQFQAFLDFFGHLAEAR